MKKNLSELHLIPFDLGCSFIDNLSLDNSKNILFAEHFVNELCKRCEEHNIFVENNIKIKRNNNKVSGIKYLNNSLADQSICIVRLNEYIYCYILANGIGVFLIADFDNRALINTDEKIDNYSIALIANYQKKITQSTILNKYSGEDVMPEEEQRMLLFREICWDIIKNAHKSKKIIRNREYSGCKEYKSDGFSYVLTIYILDSQIQSNELGHLMRGTVFSKVTNPEHWDSIQSKIDNSSYEDEPITLIVDGVKTYYSWSAVAILSDEKLSSFEMIKTHSALSMLIKAEMYVQSRWFLADNSMDNVNKNMVLNMENLQKLESSIEFMQAELDNEISANMNTSFKKILSQVVLTSEVKSLFKSVLSQIKTQRKIKEAKYQDKKSKNKLIVDLLLAIFTASSFYKTILDIINESYSWINSMLFGISILLAVGAIIINYKNR